MECRVVQDKILILLYGEIGPAERSDIEDHAAGCRECGVVLAGERRLAAILKRRPALDPSPDLLARCRRDLAEALEPARSRATTGGVGSSGPLLAWPHRLWKWTRVSPAFASALLAVGFLAGFLLGGRSAALDAERPSGRSDASARTLSRTLSAIEAEPGSDSVRLVFDMSGREAVSGSIDDPQIRSLLLSTLGESVNAGLRLEAIDLLRRRAGVPEVRAGLLRAIGDDSNPAARLEALEALDEEAATDARVREALTRALLRDVNPGVRVRAIDALARARSPESLPLLERLAREDSNEYVRMRSAAVVDALYRPGDR